MRGSVNWQVKTVFNESGINQIGESKHEAKAIAREAGAKTWADLGEKLGVHSYATADAYRDVWRECLSFAKAEFALKDIENLSAQHVAAYLDSKIEAGVAHATFMQYAAAVGKLETALNMYAERFDRGVTYQFREAISPVRAEAHQELSRFHGSRAYAEPRALASELKGDFKLAATVQLEGGCRVHEASLIRDSQLRGLRADPFTGQEKGYIQIKGKGGKIVEIGVSKETYQKLQGRIRQNGSFKIDKDFYRQELKEAALRSGQDYSGSHGLRWSHAQERFNELQQHGLSYEQALSQVSREMGHERADITEHYLK